MREHCSYTLYLGSWENKAWEKKIQVWMGFEPVLLPTELSSQPGAGHWVIFRLYSLNCLGWVYNCNDLSFA